VAPTFNAREVLPLGLHEVHFEKKGKIKKNHNKKSAVPRPTQCMGGA
jgi:hypothetical protein